MHYIICLFLNPDFPLIADIEGPARGTQTVATVGARSIAHNMHDRNIGGTLSSIAISTSNPSPYFSYCVPQCLDQASANTDGSAILTKAYDVTARQLVLNFPATPISYQNVLSTVSYIDNATIPNIRSVTLLVSNGINTANATFPVTVLPSMRKKRELKLPSTGLVDGTAPFVDEKDKKDTEAVLTDGSQESLAPLVNWWPTAMSAALLLLMLLSAVLGVWSAVQRRRAPEYRAEV